MAFIDVVKAFADEGIPFEHRVCPEAALHMACYILNKQPGLLPVRQRSGEAWLNLAMKRQQIYNEYNEIGHSFEQTGRLFEKGSQLASYLYTEEKGVEAQLILPDSFKDIHPTHLARIAVYYATKES